MLDWIIAGIAGTYLHKKFPKQTEAIAKGILKTTEFVARKAYEGLSKTDGRVIDGQVIDAVEAMPQKELGRGGEDWQVAIVGARHEGLALTMFRSRSRAGSEAYGYTDQDGSTVIAPRFSAGGNFSNGLAAVRPVGSSRWGYINRLGYMVIPAQFDYAESFTGGFRAQATVSQAEATWQIDKHGRRCR